MAVALLSYVVPTLLEGNGYLSVYITGILLGNSQLENKKALLNFFDGATGLMQMLLFFLLGLLSFPSQLPAIAPTALAVVLFLTFVARPAVVFLLMAPFRSSPRQMALVAWSGMRGAASIVFSILAISSPAVTNLDLYHIVFFICPLFHPGPGHPYPRGGQKAEHDRPGGQRLENLHRLHR